MSRLHTLEELHNFLGLPLCVENVGHFTKGNYFITEYLEEGDYTTCYSCKRLCQVNDDSYLTARAICTDCAEETGRHCSCFPPKRRVWRLSDIQLVPDSKERNLNLC